MTKEADLKELTELIKGQAKAHPRGPDFCQIWPQVKDGLGLLKAIIGSIPGVSFFAKAAIDIVIAAGDAAVAALCKK